NGASVVLSKGSVTNLPAKFMDLDIFQSIEGREGSLELPHKEVEVGKDDSFDQCEAGLVEAINQSKDETVDKSYDILEGTNETESIENSVFHDFPISQSNDVTASQGSIDVSEMFSFTSAD
ncbi:hypothetical protein KI387_003368, partial [Taxus chinensis]